MHKSVIVGLGAAAVMVVASVADASACPRVRKTCGGYGYAPPPVVYQFAPAPYGYVPPAPVYGYGAYYGAPSSGYYGTAYYGYRGSGYCGRGYGYNGYGYNGYGNGNGYGYGYGSGYGNGYGYGPTAYETYQPVNGWRWR